MQNIQKYRVICKILKTRRLWLRFIVKERPARRHIMCLCLLEIIATAKSSFFAESARLEERSLHHAMDGVISKGGGPDARLLRRQERFATFAHAKMGVPGRP